MVLFVTASEVQHIGASDKGQSMAAIQSTAKRFQALPPAASEAPRATNWLALPMPL